MIFTNMKIGWNPDGGEADLRKSLATAIRTPMTRVEEDKDTYRICRELGLNPVALPVLAISPPSYRMELVS